MIQATRFYIHGQWIDPEGSGRIDVINPSSEQPVAKIALANAEDVDKAVSAARMAFEPYAATFRRQRSLLLKKLAEIYQARSEDMARAITLEMGAPVSLSRKAQVPAGLGHLLAALEILETFAFEEDLGTTRVFKEPIGVCGLITPWNWPMNQILCKVAPALAVGCTVVLKPSQAAPLSAYLLAEMIHEAGFPPGVFNLINGSGPEVGQWLATHPEVDMISLTGSTRAGADVSRHAAGSIKRVSLELGGKSALIILEDADLEKAVRYGVMNCFHNTGQSCNAPTRMLVPGKMLGKAVDLAKTMAESLGVGPPEDPKTFMGPQANQKQWSTVQGLIQSALDEGYQPVCGGPGKPPGLGVGFYSKPTVFAEVDHGAAIARTEVFGPVLAILPFEDEDQAVRMANDSPYGLSGYVHSENLERARQVASKMRTGMVHINGASPDFKAPFGGYKQSGNGREWGAYGFNEFLEIKAIMGYEPR